MSAAQRKISFPPDSVLNAVIQDADISELLKILRNKRGKVNINQSNHVGLTALHQAVLSNNLDAVKMLLTHGSDVNAQDVNGFSPLHTASACGFLQISSLLVVYGADVFLMNKHAEYPIDIAKDLNIVRLLSEEMYRRLHSEMYVHSLFVSKVWQLWAVILKWAKYAFRLFLGMYTHYVCKQTKSVSKLTKQGDLIKDSESEIKNQSDSINEKLNSVNTNSDNQMETKQSNHKNKYD